MVAMTAFRPRASYRAVAALVSALLATEASVARAETRLDGRARVFEIHADDRVDRGCMKVGSTGNGGFFVRPCGRYSIDFCPNMQLVRNASGPYDAATVIIANRGYIGLHRLAARYRRSGLLRFNPEDLHFRQVRCDGTTFWATMEGASSTRLGDGPIAFKIRDDGRVVLGRVRRPRCVRTADGDCGAAPAF
jgi:hypothetical protein